MSGRSLVHINGRAYDGSRPLSRSIDGMVNQPKKTHRTPAQPNTHHRKVQKTHTLHRAAVKKPQHLSDVSPAKPAQAPILQHAHQTSRAQVAKHIERSPQIKKFSDFQPAQAQPMQPMQVATPKPAATPEVPPVALSATKSELFIERQLRLAEAHQKQLHKKKRFRDKLMHLHGSRRVLRVSAAVLAGFVVFGFIAYQNSTGISMRIASRRAGFSASLPTYTPSGYAVDQPIAYSEGKVILSFGSTTSDKSYQIEQRPSQWSSDTLQEQVASANGGQYQTYQSKGLKIFFTDNNTATWVHEGVLFTLQGDSGLAGEQIASIAASM